MFDSLVILGRQPTLSLAELESLYGAENIKPFGKESALLKLPPTQIDFIRIGGSMKLCKVLTEIESLNWREISKFISDKIPNYISEIIPGKIKFGISVYGLRVSPNAVNATGLEVKKVCKKINRSMRVVPNKEMELNSAQVLNNKLTDKLGLELVVATNGKKTIIAQTTNVQDIDAYAARDQQRPARDTRVGMLPPKLAQIILNMAQVKSGDKLLDPFCGTGVILQEALLMGCCAYGTDLEPRMIEYSLKNLTWLIGPASHELAVGDATNFTWQNFDAVACETFLGRPFSTEPNPDKLREVIQDANTIHRKFLKNIASQAKSRTRMCIAVPAWFTKSGVKRLPVLDQLTDMGYTRISFVHSNIKDLVYHREGQIVGRELVVLIRN